MCVMHMQSISNFKARFSLMPHMHAKMLHIIKRGLLQCLIYVSKIIYFLTTKVPANKLSMFWTEKGLRA